MRKMLTVTLSLIVAAGASLALAEPTVGWRTDGTSQYPDAKPPTEWSPEKNVVWKTPLPAWSNATPVVLADRIIICGEPTDLICLNKADGKILWKASNSYADVMTPEEDAQIVKDKAEADRMQKEEIAPLEKQRKEAQQALNALLPPKEKTPAAQPAPAPTAEQTAAIAAAKKNLSDIDAKLKKAQADIAPLLKWKANQTNRGNGESSASPVSDGKVVGVMFNNGVAAVYDLDGHRKWARFIDPQAMGSNGAGASPLIFGNKLLVHFQNLKALDVDTGKEVWSAAGTRCHYGTASLAHIGNFDVAITAAGDVVDLSNGKVLLHQLCPLEYNSPIVHDSIAYFIQNGGKAVQISVGPKGDLEAKTLWSTRPKKERYYSSPLIYDHLIYAINQTGHLSAIDAATGTVVAEKDMGFGKSTVYPSVVLAGKNIVVSSDNGQSAILEPGKDFKELGRNTIEHFACTPIFEGSRIYIRAYKQMWCIGN